MNTRLTIASALLAGVLGGLLTRYITPPVAFAQDKPPVTNNIRARSFTIIDSSDQTIGTFTAEPVPGFQATVPVSPDNPLNGPSAPRIVRPMRIVLRDSNGREIWSPNTGMKILPAVTASSK